MGRYERKEVAVGEDFMVYDNGKARNAAWCTQKLNELTAKLEAAEKRIANAPHTEDCAAVDYNDYGEQWVVAEHRCNCWKSQRSEGDE